MEGADPKGGVLWPEAKACGQLPVAGRGRGRLLGQSTACGHLDFRSVELFGLPASRMDDLNHQVWGHVSRQPREASPDPGVTSHDVSARRGPGASLSLRRGPSSAGAARPRTDQRPNRGRSTVAIGEGPQLAAGRFGDGYRQTDWRLDGIVPRTDNPKRALVSGNS